MMTAMRAFGAADKQRKSPVFKPGFSSLHRPLACDRHMADGPEGS